MAIFEKFAAELNGSYYCKSGISIADIALFNMVDYHLPLFPLHMNAFPALLAHHKKIQAEKGPLRGASFSEVWSRNPFSSLVEASFRSLKAVLLPSCRYCRVSTVGQATV